MISDIRNLVYNNQGVLSVQDVRVRNVTGTVGTRTYSDVQFDVTSNTTRGIVVGPHGSMFEIKYRDFDLVGTSL